MRKPYLDNLRWCTVLLVMVYHVCYLFNGVGVLGGIPNAQSIPALDGFITLVYPWFMVLLFLVSGICARYALEKRTNKEFLRERVRKLLVPSTLGLFVLHWTTGYLNIYLAKATQYIPPFLLYPISVVSGIGPLWFIQMLFLFSILLVLLRKLDKNDTLYAKTENAGLGALLALTPAILAAAQIGNMPVITTYRFGIYGVAFLLGYGVLSHEKVQEKLKNAAIPMSFAALAAGIWYMVKFYGTNFSEAACLQHPATNLYLWLSCLAILGLFERFCNKTTKFGSYMTKASFGFYILHYPILLGTAVALTTYLALPPAANYALSLLTMAALTPLAYELIRRVPVLRWLILGIKQ